MKHIALTADNDLIPTPYGLQQNCRKFKLKYVSDSISFKFQENAYILVNCRAYCATFSQGSNTSTTVANIISKRYSILIHIPCKRYTRTYHNQSMSKSQTDFSQYLDVSTSCIGAICVLISSCNGNTSPDVTNNQTQRILLHFYSLHYGIMYVIESEYK